MAFSLSNGVITQTGTDADLSGLSGIAGVTVTSGTLYTEYELNDLTIQVTGTLSITNSESIGFINGNTNAIIVNSGGILNFGSETTFIDASGSSVTINDGASRITIAKPTGTPFNVNQFGIRVQNGGTLNVRGGEIITSKSIGFDVGSNVFIRDGKFIFDSSIDYQNFYMSGANLDVINLKVIDKSGSTKLSCGVRNNYTRFEGFQPIGCSFGVSTIDALNFSRIDVSKYAGGGSNEGDVLFRTTLDNNEYRFFEATVGNDLIVFGFGSNQSRGFCTHYIRYKPTFKDSISSSAIEGVNFSIEDSDSGSRLAPYSPATQTYSGITNSSGTINTAIDILTAVWHNNGDQSKTNFVIDDRLGVSGGAVGYNHNISNISIIDSKLGTIDGEVLMVPDALITEPVKATAAAYTQQETPAKVYDHLKSILVDNYAGETETIVTRTGNTLNAKALDVVINNSGSGAATISGNTLTLNASEFTGNIITTGTVTGSEFVKGLISDATGTNNLITITNLTESNVQIINSLNQVLDRQENVTGDYSYTTDIGISGAHKIIINRLGYTFTVIDVDLQGQSYNFNGSLIQYRTPSGAPMYQGTTSAMLNVVPLLDGSAMRAEVGNGTVTAQQVYDETQDALMTQDGMSYLANGGGACTLASLPTGTFLFLGDNFQLKRATVGDSSATVEAFVSSTQGTVLDNVNGSVQFVTVTRAQQLTEYDGAIWVDLISGFNETQYPAGTPSRPVDTVANAKILADFYGINSIKIAGSGTSLSEELVGFSITSIPSTSASATLLPTLNLTSVNGANNCIIQGFIVEGATNVTSPVFGNEYKESVIDGLTGLTGLAKSCKLAGTLQVEYAIDLVDCYGTCAIAATGTNATVSIPTFSGALTIAGMTSATATVSVGVVAGTVTIDSSCTAGTIIVANADDVVNNGAGVTVVVFNDSAGGGSGTSDWTDSEKQQIRDALGVDGVKVSAVGGQLQAKLDTSAYTTPDNAGIASNGVAIASLNDISATDVWANPTRTVTGGTIDTNLDMRGTDGANTITPDNTSISAILADTNELQTNQNNWLTADVSSLATQASVDAIPTNPVLTTDIRLNNLDTAISSRSTFNPAADVVANVTLVDTCTTNTDMRGTDGANTVAPDNTSIVAILADTNELQLNQGNWLTADVSTLATQVSVNAIPTNPLLATDVRLNSYSTHTPADIRTELSVELSRLDATVSSRLSSASYVTPDNASIASILEDTNELQINQGDWVTATGFSTPLDITNATTSIITEVNANGTKLDTIITSIAALPDSGDIQSVSDVLGLVLKYHDNNTSFIGADGVTEVSQSDSRFMVVYDNDGTTELKRIAFQNSLGSSVSLTDATRYVKL